MAGIAGTAPALVIFDCDGVLVDSEPLSLACLTAGLNRIGVDIDVETVRHRFAGTSMTSIMEHIARDYGTLPPPGFVEAVKAETLATFDRELKAMRGVAEAIRGLGLPVCVASSSDPVRLRHSLTLTGLLPLFSGHVFSSAQVARGKPFPDLFLFAAERMGAAPASCLVIEDSVPGGRGRDARRRLHGGRALGPRPLGGRLTPRRSRHGILGFHGSLGRDHRLVHDAKRASSFGLQRPMHFHSAWP